MLTETPARASAGVVAAWAPVGYPGWRTGLPEARNADVTKPLDTVRLIRARRVAAVTHPERTLP